MKLTRLVLVLLLAVAGALGTLARYGTINEEDIDLCFRTDSVDEAFEYLTEQLGTYALDEPGATL